MSLRGPGYKKRCDDEGERARGGKEAMHPADASEHLDATAMDPADESRKVHGVVVT